MTKWELVEPFRDGSAWGLLVSSRAVTAAAFENVEVPLEPALNRGQKILETAGSKKSRIHKQNM